MPSSRIDNLAYWDRLLAALHAGLSSFRAPLGGSTGTKERFVGWDMPGVLKLLAGDLFDGPSDMIVIPCTTAGALTRFAEKRLADYYIPRPPAHLPLGGITVLPFSGGENIAQFVAYAATAGAATPVESIEAIAREIGNETTRNRTISRVVAPLIGVGAGERPGKLENALQALRRGFLSSSTAHAVLSIRVANSHLFQASARWFTHVAREHERAVDASEPVIRSASVSPRVFISYTRTSDEHAAWVESLATMLRANGIDARLDKWHLRTGMDLPQFMCNEIALADRVLIVSNDQYAERADGRLGGVGWEIMLISGDLLTRSAEDSKYLVIARTRDLRHGVPMFLKAKLVIHWPDSASDEQCRELLLRELYNQMPSAPPLGPPPVFA